MPTWPRPTVRSPRGWPAPEHLRWLPRHVLPAWRCPGRSWRSAQSRHSRRTDLAPGAPSGHGDGEKTTTHQRHARIVPGSPRKLAPDAAHTRSSARQTARTAAEEGDHASLRPARAWTVGEQNAATAERLLLSPAESMGVEPTFVSASLVTSSTSTDLTTLAQGSTQAFDLAL